MASNVAKTFKSQSAMFPRIFKLVSSTPTNPHRFFSISKSQRKNQHRVNDNGFDNYMERQTKINEVLKLRDIILSQPNSMASISRLGLKADNFFAKFPHFFEVFDHPVHTGKFCKLSVRALEEIEEENKALLAQIPVAVTRVRKLLMLSNNGKIRVDHVRLLRKEFGLPDDFEFSVIMKNHLFFKLTEDDEKNKGKYIEIVGRDEGLARCAVDTARKKRILEKGDDSEKIRYSFPLDFPHAHKVFDNIPEWQRMPYSSPYEHVNLPEAQNRIEKRAVALIHELLSLTVEKKLIVEHLTHFRSDMDLPKKLKEFVIQHPGIFYVTSKGSHGKLHTVFLKGAYKEGKLIEVNGLYLARKKLADFILYPRKEKAEKKLSNDVHIEGAKRDCSGDELYDFASGITSEQD